jgi:hypothetical protein
MLLVEWWLQVWPAPRVAKLDGVEEWEELRESLEGLGAEVLSLERAGPERRAVLKIWRRGRMRRVPVRLLRRRILEVPDP